MHSKIIALSPGVSACRQILGRALAIFFMAFIYLSLTGCNRIPDGTRNGDLLLWNGTNWVALPSSTNSFELLCGQASGAPQWRSIQSVFEDLSGHNKTNFQYLYHLQNGGLEWGNP